MGAGGRTKAPRQEPRGLLGAAWAEGLLRRQELLWQSSCLSCFKADPFPAQCYCPGP